MSNSNINNYNILGTLNNNGNYTSYIVSKIDNTDKNSYIMNKFPQDNQHKKFFTKMFSYFSSSNRTKDMVDFFATSDSFYLVFKYENCEPIEKIFSKKLNIYTYEQRCSILKDLLIKIDSLANIPICILSCITNSSNICINNENKPVITYDLSNIDIYNDITMSNIFKNISSIIETTLKNELNLKDTVELKAVVKRCNSDYYKSIPQLIIELDKAEHTFEKTSIIQKAKNFFSKNKHILKKYSWAIGVVAVVGFGVFMYNSLFVKGNNKVLGNPIATLGNIQYILSSEIADSDVLIEPHSIEVSKSSSETSLDLTLPDDIELNSEDYIIKNKDTLSSICEAYYNNHNFVSAVKSFNNITDEKLNPGRIILLPDATEVYNYFQITI